jgi:hypothetical protein
MANLTPSQAVDKLRIVLTGINNKTAQYAEYKAAEIENKMKIEAPWTDRTGNARNSIYSVAQIEGNNVVIYSGIGIEYGKWLEIAHEKRFSIVKPTIDAITPTIKGDLAKIKIL